MPYFERSKMRDEGWWYHHPLSPGPYWRTLGKEIEKTDPVAQREKAGGVLQGLGEQLFEVEESTVRIGGFRCEVTGELAGGLAHRSF